jgi:riboflavin kinase/FMN adenylyltransferase
VKIIHAIKDLNAGSQKVCVAIGFFDGVHLGHQQILRQTISDAQQHEAISVVVTFDVHPNSVVAPQRVPPLIYPLSKKLRVIESLGLDAVCLVHFDKSFSEITGEEFIRGLARDFKQVQSICVGSDFTFGHKRSGNVALLRTLGQELKFSVHGLANVSLDNQTVSSTRVRDAIRAGNLDFASQMLGRSYSLGGRVIEGAQVGRKLGFPTANLDVAGLVLPPGGVYAAHARVCGKSFRAAVNIGHRPTIESSTPKLHVEAHLLDVGQDIYGEELELTFVSKLRDEKKFPSSDALREQIGRDIEAARALF